MDLILLCIFFFQQHASNGSRDIAFFRFKSRKDSPHASFWWVVCGMTWPHMVGWLHCYFARGRALVLR